MSINFRFLTGDVNWQTYGGKFISRKLNNGEFDYWLVMDVMNWEDATGEKPNGDTYCVSLHSVSPQEAGKENLQRAFECCGMEQMSADVLANPLVQVEALESYGVYATLWTENGTNLRKLRRTASGIPAGIFNAVILGSKHRLRSRDSPKHPSGCLTVKR